MRDCQQGHLWQSYGSCKTAIPMNTQSYKRVVRPQQPRAWSWLREGPSIQVTWWKARIRQRRVEQGCDEQRGGWVELRKAADFGGLPGADPITWVLADPVILWCDFVVQVWVLDTHLHLEDLPPEETSRTEVPRGCRLILFFLAELHWWWEWKSIELVCESCIEQRNTSFCLSEISCL